METQMFAVSEYCVIHQVDPSFIRLLEGEGLIRITSSNEQQFIEADQLPELETFTRWHHDLGINIAGIDAIRNLLKKLRQVHTEMSQLRSRLKLYEDDYQ